METRFGQLIADLAETRGYAETVIGIGEWDDWGDECRKLLAFGRGEQKRPRRFALQATGHRYTIRQKRIHG